MVRNIDLLPIRRDTEPCGGRSHRDCGLNVRGCRGRVDHRNSIVGLVRDIDACPVWRNGDAWGDVPTVTVAVTEGGVVEVSITETVLELKFTT
jgi:hypothetical protein